MTEILCRWLNDEVKLSKPVDNKTFSKDFSNGFLIGELLARYQLQNDFDKFSQNRTAESKLNNFTRLEPTLRLLEVDFDTNIAHSIMTEQHGVATRLLYQLFIGLGRKQKANLTGVAMETMRPAAPVKLEGIESEIYKERLKILTPRQTDQNLGKLQAKFDDKWSKHEQTMFREKMEEEERYRRLQSEESQKAVEKARMARQKQTELLAKLRAATVEIPKPPPSKTLKAIKQRKDARRFKEAEDTRISIKDFENKLKSQQIATSGMDDGSSDLAYSVTTEDLEYKPPPVDLIQPGANDDYIGKIKRRLEEDSKAREEREKRRRKVLVDQLKAHDAQEEAHREEMLVNRLMRQSQQERRIAVQLLQARHEKDIIRKNRIFLEKQYDARRVKDFEDALNKEKELAQLAKLEYIEQTKAEQELHDRIAAERAEQRYRKHYDMCMEVTLQIVDYATKFGEYRELTEKLVPPKLFREWTQLFIEGHPLYEERDPTAEGSEPTPEQIIEMEKQKLLNDGDFKEYKEMIGEWVPPDGSEINNEKNNNVVGHIIQRIFNIVSPPKPPPPPPEFPPFPVRACAVGKLFGGKSSALRLLAERNRLAVLSPDQLVTEAVEAFKNGEVLEDVTPPVSDDVFEEVQAGTEVTPATQVSDKPEGEVPAQESSVPGITPQPSVTTVVEPATPEAMEKKAASAKPDGEDQANKSEGDKPPLSGSATPLGESGGLSPRSSVRKSSSKKSDTSHPEPTTRAKLGSKAIKSLRRGKSVDDQILVDIVIDAIRRLPEGTGWILDGFPMTLQQAKLLEKALTGSEPAASGKVSATNRKLSKKSSLALDPNPGKEPPAPPPGIDVVILFDIPDDVALKRAAGRSYAPQADQQYQQEFNPPPEGSQTGLGKTEKVIPVEDPAHDQEQVQHRITGFHDAWSKLDKLFTKMGVLSRVDADMDQSEVVNEVERVLQHTLDKLQGKDIKPPEIVEDKSTDIPPLEIPQEMKDGPSQPPSKQGSRAGSARPSSSKKDARSRSVTVGVVTVISPGISNTPASPKGRKSPKGSARDRSGSPSKKKDKLEARESKSRDRSRSGSAKRGGSGKKGKKTPVPEPEPEPDEEPTGPPPPQPGSDEWEYVSEPITDEVAQILSPHWETVEGTYVGASKVIFHKLREERESIIRYLYSVREDYKKYLKRPDGKQEFLSHWQEDYNNIPEDMREDEDTRAELHQRVDDLKERLWDICDTRKEEAETERSNVMHEGWLEDHLGTLTNHYITLMQVEVDRFQDTSRLLKDYYRAMEGQIPDELQEEYVRIPLVELLPTERPGSQAKSVASDTGTQPPASPESKAGRGKKGKEDKGDDSAGEDDDRPRIPLVPRRPRSADLQSGQAKAAKGKGGKKEDKIESPSPPLDPDERLIFDAYAHGIHAANGLISSEQAAREAEEEAERLAQEEREREKERKAKEAQTKTKKKSGKKGKGAAPEPEPEPEPVEEESPEDLRMKEVKQKMRVEYFGALHEEEARLKNRFELIKLKAMQMLQSLKAKSEGTYRDMEDWLGARFLREMAAIDHLTDIVRDAIEHREKVQQELVLYQEDFQIDEERKVFRTPSPPPRPDPVEQPQPDVYTIIQLKNLFNQFIKVAPSGLISNKAFMDLFQDLTALMHGEELLPDVWMGITLHQLHEMTVMLAPDSEYIDWRKFLLAAAQPWPTPSQTELLETLDRFKAVSGDSTSITKQQYLQVELWFKGMSRPPSPENPSEPKPYDRLGNLRDTFFDFFADYSTSPPTLDYVSMLMYFAVVPDAEDGFLRALSVACGTHMPRFPKKSPEGLPDTKMTEQLTQALSALASDSQEAVPPADGNIQAAGIPEGAVDAVVSLEALLKVLYHGVSTIGDSHRFSVTADPKNPFSRERLETMFEELEGGETQTLPLKVLVEHPIMQDCLHMTLRYKQPDLKAIFAMSTADIDTSSMRTSAD
ncbi:sperm flagellar protein 2-like isoform X6 [Branchiostoma lanceolatum]|uniref:sperm flagellar protein 2-like isoform X6 n=1 Tax=Branchiostoma lanceolatum TaxID=7740 RepID=UPI0034548B91